MDLVPCNERGRQSLAANLFEFREDGTVQKKNALWVASTFPSILLDVARHLIEQAVQEARTADNPADAIKHQLKPFFMFAFLLGKSPQISGLMYSYFENSSFQPLPENLFTTTTDPETNQKVVAYINEGFNDNLVKEILLNYFKYLTFNPKWFSAVWNWSELGRLMTIHLNHDIRYLATCCVSAITNPTRLQHINSLRGIPGKGNLQSLIDLQVKHRQMFSNTFRPCIETSREKASEYVNAPGMGYKGQEYPYCHESLAKVANQLLNKRNIIADEQTKQNVLKKCQDIVNQFIPVETIKDTISQIAYSILINKPLIVKGSVGSGKTSLLDYIAAQTNRISPPDYVKIQVDDLIDSKLLIGAYVCTEIPGQFEWQPGPLTKAMAYGSWIVFDDIDSAPSEMAQVIHSVIENRNLSCVSCCPIKLDSPHPDFRIMFTQKIKQSNSSRSLKLGSGFIERLCDIVDVPELTEDDIKQIIQERYKFSQQLTQIVLQLFTTSKKSIQTIKLQREAREITMRDLCKFCDRIERGSIKLNTETLDASESNMILMDAVDCFLGSLPCNELKIAAVELGLILNKPANIIQSQLMWRKPNLSVESESFTVGRIKLRNFSSSDKSEVRSTLAHTRKTLQLMEKISICVRNREPTLLVGETGVGKTTIVQYIADLVNVDLVVMNLSQQSDSSDLLGGFKPVEMREIMRPYNKKFQDLYRKSCNDSDEQLLRHIETSFTKASTSQSWQEYLKLMSHLCTQSLNKALPESLAREWKELKLKTSRLSKRLLSDNDNTPMALTFSGGSLLRAVKEGKWILLDEVNLAEPDVLQCLVLLLDSLRSSQVFMNIPGDDDGPRDIHRNFRVFACMNPATDIGKKELSMGTRCRFSEFFVDDIKEKQDLRLIVESYVKSCIPSSKLIEGIVDFYLEVRERSSVLSDISGNSPIYSLRTLCRALKICSSNVCNNMEKSLFESLKITFTQQLNDVSVRQVLELMKSIVFGKQMFDRLSVVPVPMPKDGHQYVEVEGFWVQSRREPEEDKRYIVTKSVKRNLQDLARIISLSQRKLPILIQGNTSVGKTSLISHLAKLTGNKCYRINNHEHTDLQEYIGRYTLREDGKLEFQKGVLVKAMENGYWIILDELNLAPTELLEALNRALDDNRELFIPELRQSIRANSKFMLFATQNPPEKYAGRKPLSRAFRNRFIELHFDEIPQDELEIILEKRCEMAPQYAKKIVAVLKELQTRPRESGCYSESMTMRDLFRWGERYTIFKSKIPDGVFHDWDLEIASEGLILLEGRVRTTAEADVVKGTIEKIFRKKLNRDEIYSQKSLSTKHLPAQFRHIQFSNEFKKLFLQLMKALQYKEPVLLVGQTGCGKTTACQLYAAMSKQNLTTYNCHLNTESSDFVGSVRPSRQGSNQKGERTKQTFPWVNGPLVEAMALNSVFLLDEISLADDAVLERLNSVLEPERTIVLTERNGDVHVAGDLFRIVATMNPGGDYGKKELSPALRNRFTEIYCHNTTDVDQIMTIVHGSLSRSLLKPKIAPHLMSVMKKFLQEYLPCRETVSIRDILSWTHFLNKTTSANQPRPLTLQEALINGAASVFFDQFGTSGYKNLSSDGNSELERKLKSQLKRLSFEAFGDEPVYCDGVSTILSPDKGTVFFKKFHLAKGPKAIMSNIHEEFIIDAPTVRRNLTKIVRAMQLDRPILLEGDPGAGKTSVVSALAKLTGHELVRINLSEQTDISDLFGSDLPDTSQSNDDCPRFSWQDGPVLSAIKKSQWILLDEMNLASQSVLEGLNACFDHRGEIFIPELNKRVTVDRGSTRFFACQNPYSQGAARKGLPQSFLNRFTSIYIESHKDEDLQIVIKRLYPSLTDESIAKMILFNRKVADMLKNSNHEFNLRDLLYWCDLTTRHVKCEGSSEFNPHQPERFVQFVYLDRLRSTSSQSDVSDLFQAIFDTPVYEPLFRDVKLGESSMVIARSVLPRNYRFPRTVPQTCILKYQLPFIESMMKALECNKMPILVGDVGVGKRSMLRIIASLTGNELNIVGANSDMDTVELLGSFEQKSLQREVIELIDESKDFIGSLINSITHKISGNNWSQIFRHVWCTLYSTAIRDMNLSKSALVEAFRFQLLQMKELMTKVSPLAATQIKDRCDRITKRIDHIMSKFLYDCDSMYSIGNFEWIDSVLVKSIRTGEWLMIENANLLNPATLDRLNSLVERDGTLGLNEKGSGTDGIEILEPHPNFRLILSMNPKNGELSRAMRNRGVEISVQPAFFFEDFLMLLYQNGFEPRPERACMSYSIMETCVGAHFKITNERAYEHESGSVLAMFALNCIPTLTHQIRRGSDLNSVLSDLLVAHYNQNGYFENCSSESMRPFIQEKMAENSKKYFVNLNDERYNWIYLIHDLVSLSGGDANVAMLERENQIFFDDAAIETYLKPDEIVEHLDIVSTCTTIKIFLELSTHGDFDYRKGFIRETFQQFPNLLKIFENHVDSLYQENIRQISGHIPRTSLLPFRDFYVDTRNSPDSHYLSLCYDYKSAMDREKIQNRWILSLQLSMLNMVIDLVEEKTLSVPGFSSLWSMSNNYINGKILKEDLIRPLAEIAVDIYDLINGILLAVSNRLMSDELVTKMLPKFFWIQFFNCKLKKGHSKQELIALCNQLPMLWALTYQKVIVPIIKDFDLSDLVHSNRKFSHRMKDICDFLDVNIAKPCKVEKEYYNKVFNSFAWTIKISETVAREVDRLFSTLLQKYSGTAQRSAQEFTISNNDNIVASSLVWSNSQYLTAMYKIECKLLEGELTDSCRDYYAVGPNKAYEDAAELLHSKKEEYAQHSDKYSSLDYRTKCQAINRRLNGLDQYALVWQMAFVQRKMSSFDAKIDDPKGFLTTLEETLEKVGGLIISPRYYATIRRILDKLRHRRDHQELESTTSLPKLLRENADIFSVFLVDHMIENIVFDNQVVGWTKTRITTCDLPTEAPMMPEHSPITSLVASYCLDAPHLRINSYQAQGLQLSKFLEYLWRSYSVVKLNRTFNVDLAKRLLHIRAEVPPIELDTCQDMNDCECVDSFIKNRFPTYQELVDTISAKVKGRDKQYYLESIRLIYFGYVNYLEYAPIFTLDPSLKNREKLEVYKSELAHIKLELHFKNTLYYWKTGENLSLYEEPENLDQYPFSIRILVERRIKLEAKVAKLQQEHSNRPKSDDGSLYYDLRKEVEFCVQRFSNSIQSLMDGLIDCVNSNSEAKSSNMNMKCRMLIKNFEKSITRFRSEFALYGDLLTNFLVGLCFVQQGLRCLYSRFEQRMQISQIGFGRFTAEQFTREIMRVFSFNNFEMSDLESVCSKLNSFRKLERLCPSDKINNIQSTILKTVLLQLNHHILIAPSDIQYCIPIVHRIANLFHTSWLKRKLYLEDQRRKREELYRYKVSRSTLGNEISYEQQEFIDISTKFPIYDYIFKDHLSLDLLPSAAKENMETEEKITTLNRSADLSMCIDICKAHYKFMTEASRSLLGQLDSSRQLPDLDMCQVVKLESQVLYSIIRHCILKLDKEFDASSIECHILQASNLSNELQTQVGYKAPESIKSSLEILDEKFFDIYHDPCIPEVLKFQEFIYKLEIRVIQIQETHAHDSLLTEILNLTTKLSSLLLNDPFMKFITGSHTLLGKLEAWQTRTRKSSAEHRIVVGSELSLSVEVSELIDMITSWRKIENSSWRSSLHRVKQKYINNSLCDLWFHLYEAFNDPATRVRDLLRQSIGDDTFELTKEHENLLYEGFASIIKNFFEDSTTMGDFQLRLDLVFAFAIQTRFASLNEQSRNNSQVGTPSDPEALRVDFERLTTYVYNVHRQYEALFKPLTNVLQQEEQNATRELNEVRMNSWQGCRNLFEIKNNFRISHKKLNKVMNNYLNVLKRPLPSLISHLDLSESINRQELVIVSESLSRAMTTFQLHISETVMVDCSADNSLASLTKVSRILDKMKHLEKITLDHMRRYVTSLEAIELVNSNNSDAIKNFYSHRVQDVVITTTDSKEAKAEKHKLCRQMYHSKKFALQSVFKSLQTIGVSYQRGLNSSVVIDRQILSLEPLRGMIQSQSRLVLDAASNLVSDASIASCNSQYRELIASFTCLMADQACDNLTGEQVSRISGLAMDFIRDINIHGRNAAIIYKDLIVIQAALTRLFTLQQRDNSNQILAYNFKKSHLVVKHFSEIVGRSMLALAKLDELCACYERVQINANYEPQQIESARGFEAEIESGHVQSLMNEFDVSNALITENQYKHIKQYLVVTRREILTIGDSLRDMLKYNNGNHIYSRDNMRQLRKLYEQYMNTFTTLLPTEIINAELINCRPGTFFGSFITLLAEAKKDLLPNLSRDGFGGDESQVVEMVEFSNLKKLDMRLDKLIRQIKLAAQGMFINEQPDKSIVLMSESMKRKMKPFNHIDSCNLRKILRANSVARHVGNCFKTLNNEQTCHDISPLVSKLTPILSVYTQGVACYINIILASMQLKLDAATKLFSFFIDLKLNGFGLPYKASDDGSMDGGAPVKQSEDNTGFGEGQGDTDVSKKLEFESQLDDLKKDDGKEKEEEKREENIDAHDDGVEMSDDIDAQAKGAESNKEDQTVDDEEQKEEENFDELDNELDQVDEDEGKLDESLWDEKDETLFDEEDDEQDLREADAESSDRQTNADEKQMDAKDEELQDSGVSDDRQEKNQEAKMEEEPDDKKSVNKEPMCHPDDIGSDEDLNDTEDGKLDIKEEAEQAMKQQEAEDVDMPTKEDESENTADIPLSDEQETNAGDDDKGNITDEPKAPSPQRSEGEISGDDESPIDDDDIDNRLEVALDPLLSKEEMRNPIDEQIAQAPNTAKSGSGAEMKGKMIGNVTVYDIIPCEPNDPLDFADPPEGEQDDRLNDIENEQAIRPSSSKTKDQPESGRQDVPMDSEDVKEDDKNRNEATTKEDEEADEKQTNSSTKRTLADRDSNQERDTLKRRRILDAAEEEEKKDQESDGQKKAGAENRHTEQQTTSTVELIDLVSSEDDEPLEDDPTVDQGSETQLKPRGDTNKSVEEKQNPDPKTGEKDDSEEIDIMGDDEIDEPPLKKDSSEAPENLSPISSLDLGDHLIEENPDGQTSLSLDDKTDYHTNYGLLKFISITEQSNNMAILEEIDKALRMTTGGDGNVEFDRETRLLLNRNWSLCRKSAERLIHELNHQLQIVLQPTKMSKYKGDYKSGKRLNMRKIVSYVASNYTKDKIWLRRTKPSKRTYDICLAVDNSSSMSENNCRLMTYQSLALLAESLSIIEAGSLNVVSFGEKVKCIHEFGQPYNHETGSRWLHELRFNESKTLYKQLLQYSCQSFAKQAQASQSSTALTKVNQLLLILSDGRNVSHEEEDVKLYLRQLKSQGVMTLFIVIDDLNRNKGGSIVDIKRTLRLGTDFKIINYMEMFPFPFYLLLQKIDRMPVVLGEALRQWFELVS